MRRILTILLFVLLGALAVEARELPAGTYLPVIPTDGKQLQRIEYQPGMVTIWPTGQGSYQVPVIERLHSSTYFDCLVLPPNPNLGPRHSFCHALYYQANKMSVAFKMVELDTRDPHAAVAQARRLAVVDHRFIFATKANLEAWSQLPTMPAGDGEEFLWTLARVRVNDPTLPVAEAGIRAFLKKGWNPAASLDVLEQYVKEAAQKPHLRKLMQASHLHF